MLVRLGWQWHHYDSGCGSCFGWRRIDRVRSGVVIENRDTLFRVDVDVGVAVDGIDAVGSLVLVPAGVDRVVVVVADVVGVDAVARAAGVDSTSCS